LPLFPPPQKNRSAPSDSSPETWIPRGISRLSRTSPVGFAGLKSFPELVQNSVATVKLIPHAELAVIPNASHFALSSEPERVIPIIADIARLKARMGWEMPWYTITDSFDKDFGVDEWHGHNVFFRDGDKVFRTYFINNRGDEAMGTIWSYLDITPLGRQETWEDSPEGYPQTAPYKWWNWHDNYDAKAVPDPKWVDIITDPEGAAARRRDQEAKAS
jgi:Bacterial protein of unknown function (DUF899)